jgi:phosphoribosylformylglycinamidine (FGAM) synthase-like amidotransferase family enzyme
MAQRDRGVKGGEVFVFHTENLINRKEQWAIPGGFGAGDVLTPTPQAAMSRHESGLVRI